MNDTEPDVASLLMKEGDYFRWSFRVLPKTFEPYWCASRIGFVHNGMLHDTYWGRTGSVDSKRWNPDDALRLLHLVFVANIEDMEEAHHGAIEDHRAEDIVDLSHVNTRSEVFLRKGARRDKATQLATYTRKRDEAQRQADGFQACIDRLDETWTGT
jgi:hypothetical protein